MNPSHWVYLHLDAAGDVLYVGCTGDLRRRTRVHKRTAAWREQIATVKVDGHYPYPDALRREAELIREHRPPNNRNCNPDYEEAQRARRFEAAKALYADLHAWFAAQREATSAHRRAS